MKNDESLIRSLSVSAMGNEVPCIVQKKNIFYDSYYTTENATKEQSFRLNNFRFEKRVQNCLSHFISLPLIA